MPFANAPEVGLVEFSEADNEPIGFSVISWHSVARARNSFEELGQRVHKVDNLRMWDAQKM
eukprot:scaffold23831_cov30-Tisochrysis_lutea.AAC.4